MSVETLTDWFPENLAASSKLETYLQNVLEIQKLHLLQDSSVLLRYWFIGVLSSLPSLNLTNEPWIASYALFEDTHLVYVMAHNDSAGQDVSLRVIEVNLKPPTLENILLRGEPASNVMLDICRMINKTVAPGTYFSTLKVSIDIRAPVENKINLQPYTVKIQKLIRAHKLPTLIERNQLQKYALFCRSCTDKHRIHLPLGTWDFSIINRIKYVESVLRRLSLFTSNIRYLTHIKDPARMVVISAMAILGVHFSRRFAIKSRLSVDVLGNFEYAFFESNENLFQPFFLHHQVDQRPSSKLNPKLTLSMYSNSPHYNYRSV